MKRIINVIFDFLVIAIGFGVTDILMAQVFKSESIALELAVYFAVCIVAYSVKRVVISVLSNLTSK